MLSESRHKLPLSISLRVVNTIYNYHHPCVEMQLLVNGETRLFWELEIDSKPTLPHVIDGFMMQAESKFFEFVAAACNGIL